MARQASGGSEHVHAAVDDHSRVAYAEVLPDIKKETCVEFWGRAWEWFVDHGIEPQAVMSDNAGAYRSQLFNTALGDIDHIYIRPYQPQQNGKVERFNRTLQHEWAYARVYTSNPQRTDALTEWLHTYNHHRQHTSLGGATPIDRVNNLPNQYS